MLQDTARHSGADCDISRLDNISISLSLYMLELTGCIANVTGVIPTVLSRTANADETSHHSNTLVFSKNKCVLVSSMRSKIDSVLTDLLTYG